MCFMRECYLPAAAYNGIDLANAALYVLRRVRPRWKNLVPIAYVVHSGCIQIWIACSSEAVRIGPGAIKIN